MTPPLLDDAVRDAVNRTAELLRSLGHRVGERDPRFGRVGNAFTPLYLHGIHDDVRAVPHPERLESRTRGFGRMGGLIPRRSVQRAVAAIPKHAQKIGRVFDDHDVLLTPTVGAPPVEVGRWEGRGALRTLLGMGRVYPFTGVWNYTGQPAAAVPAGFTADGLPLSVQLVGRRGDAAVAGGADRGRALVVGAHATGRVGAGAASRLRGIMTSTCLSPRSRALRARCSAPA
jgi:amidase